MSVPFSLLLLERNELHRRLFFDGFLLREGEEGEERQSLSSDWSFGLRKSAITVQDVSKLLEKWLQNHNHHNKSVS